MIHETSVPELLLAEEEGSALLPVLCRSGFWHSSIRPPTGSDDARATSPMPP